MNDLKSLQAALDNIQEQYSALIRQQLPSYQMGMGSQPSLIPPQPESHSVNTSQDALSNTDKTLLDNISGQERLLLALYDEFINTDDGKQLAAGLSKFARFSQSKIAKENNKS